MEAAAKSTPKKRRFAYREEYGVAGATLGIILIVGAFFPSFIAPEQLVDIVRQAAYVSIMAMGMVFLLSMREIDLSVGAIFALSGVVAALLISADINPWVASLAGILAGAIAGALNGILTVVIAVPTMIVTLASLSVIRGLALALAGGQQVGGLPRDHPFFAIVGGTALGLPVSVWVVLIVAVVLTVLLTSTRFGSRVRAIGANPEAARVSGMPLRTVRVIVMALSGGLAGIAGILALGFFGAGDPTLGSGYELTAIAAAIIGGTSMAGGRGSVPGALLGTLLLGSVASGLVYFGIPINWSMFATGCVILGAVALDSVIRRVRAQRLSL
ncbi:ABC transporter permease [Leucobacter celer]|uniref:ABC transporter permease n=1 Tax=Leucobacter celer TaxID=668625 RepID=UPI0006A75CC9|nr:ABC transporter permease [Leucobacter celer]